MLPKRTYHNLPVPISSCNNGLSSSSEATKERRRAQNRISQQCLREKKRLARSYGLQSRSRTSEEPAFSSSESCANMTGDTMVDSDLMKENEELRFALLGMRKKLLSLSTSAAATASENIASLAQAPC